MNSMDIEIEKIDKAEFRKKKMHSAFKEGSSIRQKSRSDSAVNCTNPRLVSKNVPQVDIHEENFDMKNSASSRRLKENLLVEKGDDFEFFILSGHCCLDLELLRIQDPGAHYYMCI